jgi:hypothetical protein
MRLIDASFLGRPLSTVSDERWRSSEPSDSSALKLQTHALGVNITTTDVATGYTTKLIVGCGCDVDSR